MSVGAFTGTTAAIALQDLIPIAPVRLAVSLIIAAIFAAFAGFLIGVPVLRLNGDYLAIVTLAFGEIIKAVLNNLYVSVDNRGLRLGLFEGPGADFTGKRTEDFQFYRRIYFDHADADDYISSRQQPRRTRDYGDPGQPGSGGERRRICDEI